MIENSYHETLLSWLGILAKTPMENGQAHRYNILLEGLVGNRWQRDDSSS